MLRGVDVDPVDGREWNLGEDVTLVTEADETLESVMERLGAMKGIPQERMKILTKKRIIESDDYGHSLQRLGITASSNRIVVMPTSPGIWHWLSPTQYERRYVDALLAFTATPILLSDLLLKVKKPPVLRNSTQVILRKYPDLFLLETSLHSHQTTVRRAAHVPPVSY